jgi:hypothetical protein
MSAVSVKERLLAWADEVPGLDEGLANLLSRLARFADAECCTWAPVGHLAELLRKSERTVQYRLRELERLGCIQPTGRVHRMKGTTRSVPIYQLAPAVEGLGRAVDGAPAMGAKAAPIQSHGCKTDPGMGATGLHPQGTEEPTLEEANAPSSGAGAREQPSKYDLATLAWPATGQKRTNFLAAFELWAEAAAEVGEARLLAAVMACAADPDPKRGDHGYPGLHRWLHEKRYRAYLPAVGGGGRGAGAGLGGRTPFGGPAEVRAAVVEAGGEAFAASFLDPAGWDGARRVVIPKTSIAAERLRRSVGPALRALGVGVEHEGERG